MTDLTTARGTHTANFTNGERREVVLMHKSLLFDFCQIVNDLVIAECAKCRNG